MFGLLISFLRRNFLFFIFIWLCYFFSSGCFADFFRVYLYVFNFPFSFLNVFKRKYEIIHFFQCLWNGKSFIVNTIDDFLKRLMYFDCKYSSVFVKPLECFTIVLYHFFQLTYYNKFWKLLAAVIHRNQSSFLRCSEQ